MSGSDWVAIAGVATGGVVTIAVTGLNYWFQDREARRQAQRERLSQLRDVLDSAGGGLSDAISAAERRVVAQGDELEETGKAFADKLQAIQLSKNRIAIRLGNDDSVTEAYSDVVAKVQRVGKNLYDAHGALDPGSQEKANGLIDGVRAGQLRYLDRAHAVANRDL
jgi:hypothetical protein